MTERQRKRLADKHFAKLGDLLSGFYQFLGKKPQPSNDEVRSMFIKYRTAWVNYATKHNLDENTKRQFQYQVGLVWNAKAKTENDTTEKPIQP